MPQKSIFIASATESKPLAAKIDQGLADAGYRPLRWWQEFPAGSLTLDRLLEIAESADGAAFLLTAVDRTWYRQELSGSPRDNVILEYGMFIARIGPQRTLMLAEPGTKLPSDVAGISYERIVDDAQSIVERIIEHFDREFSDPLPPPLESIHMIADPIVVEQQILNPLPASWFQRDLYFGIEGAKGWLAAVGELSYAPRVHELELRHLQIAAIELISVRTFVSFGPGDAEADKEIAISLRNREPWLQYIPVDISDGLLQRAVKLLSDQVRVPIGILGDFEDRLNFIALQIRDHAVRPILFSLLGKTLGNLDKYERGFLSTLGATVMRPGDHLLLDVSLAGPRWSRDLDRRCQHASYGPGNRRFIATAVSRRTGDSIESIVDEFETRISFGAGGSDVPGAQSIDIVDSRTRRVISRTRRYEWKSFLNWLENRTQLQIVFKEALFADDILGDGVVLLRRN
jgi:Predicted nucleotide-binding protein containing TIR-like domain/Histidine-specific methyltransferase, SAM-dependent